MHDVRPQGKVLLTDGKAKSCLAAARALAGRGLRVHVASDTRLSLALWSRVPSGRHLLPSSRTSPAEFAAALAALHARERFDAVIPVSDYDIHALLANPGQWRKSGLPVALPEPGPFDAARDKSRMMKSAMRAGVPCPGTWFPEDEPIASILPKARFPLLVKPNISDGARGITLVEDPAALESTYRAVAARWGPCHLQEWIPEGGGQLKADMIVGRDGSLLAAFVCRKIRYYPVKGGSSTLIASEHDESIVESMRRLAAEMKWFGFADFDLIVDPRDGVAKLMECNPRFPESLAVNIFAGADFPWCLYQLASSGHADRITGYAANRYARFLVGDIMWFLGSPDRWRAKPSFFRFLGRDMTYYVEKATDPGPIACYVIEAILTLLSPRRMAYRFGRGFSAGSSASPAKADRR
jgi:D-aspartate ligase